VFGERVKLKWKKSVKVMNMEIQIYEFLMLISIRWKCANDRWTGENEWDIIRKSKSCPISGNK
jgi:hypothetical protein